MESGVVRAILSDGRSGWPRGSEMTIELVERAQRGDRDAFEMIARASIDRLYAIARRVLRDPTLAEDAVQDCLFRAWRDLRALRDPARIDAWLYRLLLNACRDEQRRRRRRPEPVDLGLMDTRSAEEPLAAVHRRDEIERGFARLSVDHRMALVLRHYVGLRPAEIARVLSIPEGTATSRIHYGQLALRAVLNPSPVAAEGGRDP